MMMTRLGTATLLALALTTTAQAQSVEDLEGLWQRQPTEEAKTARYYQFKVSEGVVKAEMLNPPFKGMTCSVDLTLEASKVEGTAKWTEGKHSEKTAWIYTLEDGQLSGRSEVIDWEEGVVYSRGWAKYTMVKLQGDDVVKAMQEMGHEVETLSDAAKKLGYSEKVGLVFDGTVEDEGFGDPPGDLAAFAGGWMGPGGPWAVKLDGDKLIFTPFGHHKGTSIHVVNDRDTLKGKVSLKGGAECKVELGSNEGALSGRSSWTAGPYEGWAPVSFTRLTRDESGGPVPADWPPKNMDVKGVLLGVWKRDDGLYLRVRKESGGVTGVLSDKQGKARCRVSFKNKKGLWTGSANWGAMKTDWELAITPDGLVGRCEWVDLHEKKVVAKGWGGRTFSKLERAN